MTTPKSSQAVHTPRRILSNISNGVSASRAPSCANRDNTPVRGSGPLWNTRNGKKGSFGSDVFIASQQLSKAHGDLSYIRPKSPPLYNLSAALGGLQLDDHSKQEIHLPHDDIPAFISPLAAPTEEWTTAENETEPTKRGPHQYTRTPRYSLGSPLIPSRLRKHHTHYFEILSDTHRVDVGGLSLGYFSALDLYKPVIRAYPAENGRAASNAATLDYLRSRPPVEHIDVCTTWKGLSLKEAELLFQLNRAFKTCLEDLIEVQMEELDQNFRQQQSRGITNVVGDSATATFCTRSVFSRTKLVESMIRLLQSSQEYFWDLQTSHLKRLLSFYLTSCDYLIDIERNGAQNTAIDLRFQYHQSLLPENPRTLAVEAGWSPDFLTFERLAIVPHEGKELQIIPRYNSHAVFRIDGHHTDLRYSLETPLSWLTWDDKIQGFKGIVPMYSEIRGTDSIFGKVYRPGRVGPDTVVNQLRIEIKALFTECFQSTLRLERTVRTCLTIRVVPWYAEGSANAPGDDSVRPIKPETAQSYVDDLFVRGVSEEIDPGRIPAAHVQIRRVTGLSSLQGRDDLFDLGLSSQTSSDRSFNYDSDNARNSTSGLHPHEEEMVSTVICNQFSIEPCSDMATSTEGLREDEEEDTGCCDQSLTSVIGNPVFSSVGLQHEEARSVSTERSTGFPPLIFYNRYSPLHGLRENVDGRSDESDGGSVSSMELATSHSGRKPLKVRTGKAIQYSNRLGKNTTFGIGTWSEENFLAGGGVAIPVDALEFL